MTRVLATVVVSDVPEPAVSPCGICRQFLREFSSLDMEVYIVSATYPVRGAANIVDGKLDESVGICRTLGDLLPLSFGPDHLRMARE